MTFLKIFFMVILTSCSKGCGSILPQWRWLLIYQREKKMQFVFELWISLRGNMHSVYLLIILLYAISMILIIRGLLQAFVGFQSLTKKRNIINLHKHHYFCNSCLIDHLVFFKYLFITKYMDTFFWLNWNFIRKTRKQITQNIAE